MSNETKSLMSQLNAIVSLPSVSSAIPKLDTSNAEVIEFLANSFISNASYLLIFFNLLSKISAGTETADPDVTHIAAVDR